MFGSFFPLSIAALLIVLILHFIQFQPFFVNSMILVPKEFQHQHLVAGLLSPAYLPVRENETKGVFP